MGHVFPTGTVVLPMLGEVSRTALITGIVVAVLTWAVIIGGIQKIGWAAEKLAPAKVALYLIGGLVVIVTHVSTLPLVIALVFREAFSLHAAGGTAAGLGVAIPALFGYNWLASRAEAIGADMAVFVDEFSTRLAEEQGEGRHERGATLRSA